MDITSKSAPIMTSVPILFLDLVHKFIYNQVTLGAFYLGLEEKDPTFFTGSIEEKTVPLHEHHNSRGNIFSLSGQWLKCRWYCEISPISGSPVERWLVSTACGTFEFVAWDTKSLIFLTMILRVQFPSEHTLLSSYIFIFFIWI